MKQYFEPSPQHGVPMSGEGNRIIFQTLEKRAEHILGAVKGLPVCTALALLDNCKKVVMQSTVDVD